MTHIKRSEEQEKTCEVLFLANRNVLKKEYALESKKIQEVISVDTKWGKRDDIRHKKWTYLRNGDNIPKTMYQFQIRKKNWFGVRSWRTLGFFEELDHGFKVSKNITEKN